MTAKVKGIRVGPRLRPVRGEMKGRVGLSGEKSRGAECRIRVDLTLIALASAALQTFLPVVMYKFRSPDRVTEGRTCGVCSL